MEKVAPGRIEPKKQPAPAPKQMQDRSDAVIEPLEEINLSSDPNVQKPVSISTELSSEEKHRLIDLLKQNVDVFLWSYEEMPSATYQRAMTVVFHDMMGKEVEDYLLQLSEFDITYTTLTAIKSQAVINLMTQFEYEAFLTGMATTRNMGIKKLKVIGDSNLVVKQMNGDIAVKEPALTHYRTMAQRMVKKFKQVVIEHTPESGNRYTDALVTLGSRLCFSGEATSMAILKKDASII
ncbi:hypothetical protein L484_006000 [Morus notabilis]|uniref:RNase H type-1 domain-containing protein n=1 Tax=Morus notabilis TaxID=981085 RepID=W9RER5_9ROSA|nr:hypothetical protein L484_006000 [Morus notabilis]